MFDSEEGTLTDEKNEKVYSDINSGDDNTFFMVARVENLAEKGAKPKNYFKALKDSFYYATRRDGRFYYKEFNTKELDEELTSQMFDIIYVLSHPNEMYDGILNGHYDSNELTILDWNLASVESNIGQLRCAIKEVVGEDEDS